MTAWWAVAVGAVVLVVVAVLVVLRRRSARASAASVSDWRSRAASDADTASGPSSASGAPSDLDSRSTARAARRSGSRRRAASRSPLPSASGSGSRTSPDATDDPFARYPTARQRPVPNPTTRVTPPRDPSRNRPYLAPLPTSPLDRHPTPSTSAHHDTADGAPSPDRHLAGVVPYPPKGDNPSGATGVGRPQPREEEASSWERPQPARQGTAPTSAAGSYPHPASSLAGQVNASQPRAPRSAEPEQFDSSGTTPTQPVYLPDLRHTGPGRTPDTTTWPDAGLPQPRNSPSLRPNRDAASFSSMPSHQPGAQRPPSADETHNPVERDWPGLRLVDQDPGDRRRQPVEPQSGVPTAGNAGRRLVGPPERRRWGRGTRPPEDEPGQNPRRPDDR